MKRAELAVVGVGLERDRLVEVEVAVGDLVEFEVLGGQVFLRVDVDLVLDLGHRRADRARAELQPVRAPRQQRVFAHPQQVRGELVGDLRRTLRAGDHVAAADVEFVGERQRDRLRRPRRGRGRRRRSTMRATFERRPDGSATIVVAGPHLARGNRAGEAAEIRPWSVRSGRLTHCTGRRKPISAAPCAASTCSRYSSTLGPVVPRRRRPSGAAGCRRCSADSGIGGDAARCRAARRARGRRPTISSNTAWS